MPPDIQTLVQVLLEIFILLGFLFGLVGLIVPVFPGLTVMWIFALIYVIVQNMAGKMTGWDWFLFALITALMLFGNIADNLIIARKMRDKYVPWSSILWAFAAGIV